MRIGLITYASNHLKTEQIAVGLHNRGYADLQFFALPFSPRPPRTIVFEHRPDMAQGGHSKSVAKAINADYREIASANEIDPDSCDLFLITGAGILPPEFVDATLGRVLNSHPGKIPLVRGLDAFKWAILDQNPVENTLHFIDAEADAGTIVAQFPTPVFASDTLAKFAARHYEIEIDMMLDFEAHVERTRNFPFDPTSCETGTPRMRMKEEDQQRLFPAFEAYKRRYAVDR